MSLKNAIGAHLLRCFNPHMALPCIGLKRLASAHHSRFSEESFVFIHQKTKESLRER